MAYIHETQLLSDKGTPQGELNDEVDRKVRAFIGELIAWAKALDLNPVDRQVLLEREVVTAVHATFAEIRVGWATDLDERI